MPSPIIVAVDDQLPISDHPVLERCWLLTQVSAEHARTLVDAGGLMTVRSKGEAQRERRNPGNNLRHNGCVRFLMESIPFLNNSKSFFSGCVFDCGTRS